MNDLIKVDHGHLWTTSLLVAEKFGKRHDNVIRAIQKLECSPEFNRLNFEEIEYKDSRGRMMPAFRISRDGFTMLAMGFTGAAAAQWREKFIGAFNQMERELLQQKQPDWKAVRYESKTTIQAINETLQEVRTIEGKATPSHIYSNEARLLNSVITGHFKGLDRDSLDAKTLEILTRIQVRDAVLIARGLSYEQRKSALQQYAEKIGAKEKAPIKLAGGDQGLAFHHSHGENKCRLSQAAKK